MPTLFKTTELARATRLSSTRRISSNPKPHLPSSSVSRPRFTTASSVRSASSSSSTFFPSRNQLLAAGFAVAAGATVAANWSSDSNAVASTSSMPLEVLDLNDPLSALAPQVLTHATSHLQKLPVSELLRQYVVYLGSSQGYLVAAGPWLLEKLEWTRENVPVVGGVVWSVFSTVMKGTYYSVFVGAESVPACAQLVHDLAEHGIGCLLNYSAEASGSSANAGGINEANLAEARSAIRASALFESPSSATTLVSSQAYNIKPTLFAIKLSGLVFEPQVLARATSALVESSSYARGVPLPSETLFPDSPSLSEDDHKVLGELYEGLRDVSKEAKLNGVRLLVDAEQSWFQPAIDRYVDLLSEEFNKVTPENSVAGPAIPIIHNTYQAYLRTTPPLMEAAIARADALGYSFGAKLVRGAYVEAERIRHSNLKLSGDCVVWNNKKETDECYDSCALLLEKRVADDILQGKPGQPGTGAVFASHNGESARRVLMEMRKQGLARNVEGGLEVDERIRGRIAFAQLLGMSDNLTSALVSILSPSHTVDTGIPLVVKYVPYATLDQALPYLIRRANENQAILKPDPSSGRGGAIGERRAVGRELRSRLGLVF